MKWPTVKLHSICRPRQWKTISSGDLLESGYPVYGANGKIGFYSEYTHDLPTLMITCRGATCGNVHISEPKSYINGNAMALDDLNYEKIDVKYLYYFMLKRGFQDVISGSAQPQITGQGLTKVEVPLPPLEEQKRIAAILDKADAIRRKRQQAIQLTDDFLRSVFLDMFGSSSNNLTWKKINFGEVTEINAPMIDPQEKEYSGLIHIGPDRIEKNNGRLLPSLTAKEENLISKKFLFDQSYVLYSKIRPYLRKAAIPNFIGICSADMYPIKPIEGLITREYLWQLLLSDEFTKYTETLPNRASIPKLNRKELANFSFKLPPLELQKKFSTITKQTLKNNLQNDDALEVNNLLFESLAQKAFRGEL